MPTENELKFVLRIDDELEKTIAETADYCHLLQQGYIARRRKHCLRVRREELIPTTPLTTDARSVRFYLQAKLKTNGSIDYAQYTATGIKERTAPGRTIEVGTDITERDFLDFWEKTKGRIKKFRYYLQSETSDQYEDDNGHLWQEVWEVDFFKKPNGQTYFVLAEVELPEGVMDPLFAVPDLIGNNTVFRVPLGDSRFSNSRLGSIPYATKLYRQLSLNTKREKL